MPDTDYYARRRARLMQKNPHCYWCHCLVIYYPMKDHQKFPDNYATIDHLNSHLKGPRPNVFFKKRTLVLACFKCNQKRNMAEQHKNKMWLWYKADSYPLKWKWARKYIRAYFMLVERLRGRYVAFLETFYYHRNRYIKQKRKWSFLP